MNNTLEIYNSICYTCVFTKHRSLAILRWSGKEDPMCYNLLYSNKPILLAELESERGFLPRHIYSRRTNPVFGVLHYRILKTRVYFATATRISRLACAIPAQTLGPVLGGKVIGCELPCLEDNSSSLNHRPPSRRAIIPFVVRRPLAGIFSLFFSRLIWLLFN